MNTIFLIGRLSRDPELTYLKDDRHCKCNFILVVKRLKSKVKDDVDFIKCVSWDTQAKHLVNHVQKGSLIAVKGRLKINVKEHPESGGPATFFAEVICEEVQFLKFPSSPNP